MFDVEGGSLVLEGMTIRGGRAARGGGILNHGGTLVLDRVALRGNHARVGGGLFNDGTTILKHASRSSCSPPSLPHEASTAASWPIQRRRKQ